MYLNNPTALLLCIYFILKSLHIKTHLNTPNTGKMLIWRLYSSIEILISIELRLLTQNGYLPAVSKAPFNNSTDPFLGFTLIETKSLAPKFGLLSTRTNSSCYSFR